MIYVGTDVGSSLRLGDVVWAQLEGYPFWPGMLINDPDVGVHERAADAHVQFFDKRPSRAWVKKRYEQH